MSDETGGRGAGVSKPGPRWTLVTLGFVTLCGIVALASSGGAAAQATDSGDPPEFGNATKGNLTTIALTITDDGDVDEASITASDFTLNPGSLDRIHVNESGNDTRVELFLTGTVSSDTVAISLADGGSIRDEAGNALTDATATVTGMDGFRPQLQEFAVTRIDESTARIRVVSSESLEELIVGVGGPGAGTLTMANFTKVDTPATFEVPYEATVTFDREGSYDLFVGTMTDANGVTSRYAVERTVVVDRTAPTASIAGPARATVGEPVTFDGGGSTDENRIAGYEWAIDGNASAVGDGDSTAESVEYSFETPGYHQVSLTVFDVRNNTDSTTVPIRVDGETTTDGVTFEGSPNGTVSATVGPNRSTGRVLLSRSGNLASTPALRLESLTVDIPVDASATLAFSASTPPIDFDAGNITALAGFAVEHDRPLTAATFRFSLNRSRLETTGVSPADVTLYRETTDWQRVVTTKVEESDGWITYEATAAGLSRFVVGDSESDRGEEGGRAGSQDGDVADDGAEVTSGDVAGETTGSPHVLVDNSTLLTDAIDAGDRILVRANATNRGNGTGTYRVGLIVNDSVVATTAITVPPGETRTVTFAEAVVAGGTVAVNGTIAGTLTVAGNGTARAASGGGLPIPIPNPLALWPGGLFGRLLGAVFWLVVITYAVLKSLAIYLGY